MAINVTFRRMEPVESLKAYAIDKVSKIKKYMDTPLDARIVLSVEKFRHEADVNLSINGTRINAVEETNDMYSSIDQVMDKIEKQVRRHLSKIKDHRKESIKNEDASIHGEGEEVSSFSNNNPVIEVRKMVAELMDPEEAAMQLDRLKQVFLVFRNDTSNEINIIFKRNDENFGLISPIS